VRDRGLRSRYSHDIVTRRLRSPLLLLALTVAVAAGVAAPVAEAGQAPCWKSLINDWYDGRIDNAYPVHCYRDAIKNLPEDVDAYTEAREDINRALLAAIRKSKTPLKPTDVIKPDPPAVKPGTKPQPTTTTDGTSTDPTKPTKPDDGGDDDGGGIVAPGGSDGGGVLGVFRPSSADEVPLPLLVLAGLAVLLLLAAAGGFVARRIQGRRLPPAVAPPAEPQDL
jgi:hypothetical protein